MIFCFLLLNRLASGFKNFPLDCCSPARKLTTEGSFFLSGLIDDGLQELIQKMVCLFCFTASVILRINKICLF